MLSTALLCIAFVIAKININIRYFHLAYSWSIAAPAHAGAHQHTNCIRSTYYSHGSLIVVVCYMNIWINWKAVYTMLNDNNNIFELTLISSGRRFFNLNSMQCFLHICIHSLVSNSSFRSNLLKFRIIVDASKRHGKYFRSCK